MRQPCGLMLRRRRAPLYRCYILCAVRCVAVRRYLLITPRSRRLCLHLRRRRYFINSGCTRSRYVSSLLGGAVALPSVSSVILIYVLPAPCDRTD